MSQITLYLDDETQALVENAAKANDISKSRWVSEMIKKYAAQEWSKECLALAGAFADFPLTSKKVAEDLPADIPRLSF